MKQSELEQLKSSINVVDLISIDQATTSGISYWSGENRLITVEEFTARGSRVEARLPDFRNFFDRTFVHLRPQNVVFEEILKDEGTNGFQTQKALSYYQGILIELCQRYRIPYEIYVASAWKKTFGIRAYTREEQKKSSKEIAARLTQLEGLTDNMADSIGIGYHFYNQSIKKE